MNEYNINMSGCEDGSKKDTKNKSLASSSSVGSVHLVIQRYRHCRILLDEHKWVAVGQQQQQQQQQQLPQNNDNNRNDHHHCGLLVYVGFATGASKAAVQTAAQTILKMPLLTTGLWGDGASEQGCLLDFVSRLPKTQKANTVRASLSFSLVLCPQANLISTVKGSGRSIQYRGQIAKMEGEALFEHLAACLVGCLLEAQVAAREEKELPPLYRAWKKRQEKEQQSLQWKAQQQQRNETQPDVSVPPNDFFRSNNNLYSAWDETTGIPTHDAEGNPITKSVLKKLEKFRETHAKRHKKWLLQQQQLEQEQKQQPGNIMVKATEHPSPETTCDAHDSNMHQDDWLVWKNELDPQFCHVVIGSFGKRQGLELDSDMGPFCHVLQV